MPFPESHPADLSIYESPVLKGSEALYLPTGKTPVGTPFNAGSTTRCNWIRAEESKAQNHHGSNLQHAPAGFRGPTTTFISVLSDPNKRSKLFSKGRGFFDSILLQTIAQARAKGQEAKGEEEEVMLKVGAAVV